MDCFVNTAHEGASAGPPILVVIILLLCCKLSFGFWELLAAKASRMGRTCLAISCLRMSGFKAAASAAEGFRRASGFFGEAEQNAVTDSIN